MLACTTLLLPSAAVVFPLERPGFAAVIGTLSEGSEGGGLLARVDTHIHVLSRGYTELSNASFSVFHACCAASSLDVYAGVRGFIYAACRGLLALPSALVARALLLRETAQRFTLFLFLPPPSNSTWAITSARYVALLLVFFLAPLCEQRDGSTRGHVPFSRTGGVRWVSDEEMEGRRFVYHVGSGRGGGVSRWLQLCVVYERQRTREETRQRTLTAHKRLQRQVRLESATRL